jgi:hypothetical protein
MLGGGEAKAEGIGKKEEVRRASGRRRRRAETVMEAPFTGGQTGDVRTYRVFNGRVHLFCGNDASSYPRASANAAAKEGAGCGTPGFADARRRGEELQKAE